MMTYQEILDYAASHGFDIPADCRRLIRQLSALFLVDEGERLRLYGAKREGASTWGAQYGFTFYRDNPRCAGRTSCPPPIRFAAAVCIFCGKAADGVLHRGKWICLECQKAISEEIL